MRSIPSCTSDLYYNAIDKIGKKKNNNNSKRHICKGSEGKFMNRTKDEIFDANL